MFTIACCLVISTLLRIRITVRIRFSVWLVNGYTHVLSHKHGSLTTRLIKHQLHWISRLTLVG